MAKHLAMKVLQFQRICQPPWGSDVDMWNTNFPCRPGFNGICYSLWFMYYNHMCSKLTLSA
jgi:hypothetical protein